MSLMLNKTSFGKQVKIARSGETGTITAFASHMRVKQKQFFVEYTDSLGRATEAWFFEDQLELV